MSTIRYEIQKHILDKAIVTYRVYAIDIPFKEKLADFKYEFDAELFKKIKEQGL